MVKVPNVCEGLLHISFFISMAGPVCQDLFVAGPVPVQAEGSKTKAPGHSFAEPVFMCC